jgi:hypothetical protein
MIGTLALLSGIYEAFTDTKTNTSNTKIACGIKATVAFGIAPHFLYAISTKNKKVITVKSKYTMTNELTLATKFMIVDTNDVHYCVNTSFWFNSFGHVEKWTNMEVGVSYTIYYYGVRGQMLNTFPNIYKYELYTVALTEQENTDIVTDKPLDAVTDKDVKYEVVAQPTYPVPNASIYPYGYISSYEPSTKTL